MVLGWMKRPTMASYHRGRGAQAGDFGDVLTGANGQSPLHNVANMPDRVKSNDNVTERRLFTQMKMLPKRHLPSHKVGFQVLKKRSSRGCGYVGSGRFATVHISTTRV